MSEQDWADKKAAELLPCILECHEDTLGGNIYWRHAVGCPWGYRSAVAAALREAVETAGDKVNADWTKVYAELADANAKIEQLEIEQRRLVKQIVEHFTKFKAERERIQRNRNLAKFDSWWIENGRFYDPDSSDIDWYDKRRLLAEYVWSNAIAAIEAEATEE